MGINHFPVQSSSVNPETQLHCKLPKGMRSLGTTPLRWWDKVNNTLVFVDHLLTPSLPSNRRSIWGKPYPLKYSHLVNANCQNSRFRKAAESWGCSTRMLVKRERVFKEEKCWKVLAPHLCLCLPAELPGEAGLPVWLPGRWHWCFIYWNSARGKIIRWVWSKKKKKEEKFWEIPLVQNTEFKTAVLFFTHI